MILKLNRKKLFSISSGLRPDTGVGIGRLLHWYLPPPKWEMDLEQYPDSNMISAFKDHSIFLVTNHFGFYFQIPFLGSTFSCFRQKSFRISENECAFSGVYIQMKLCLVFVTFYF